MKNLSILILLSLITIGGKSQVIITNNYEVGINVAYAYYEYEANLKGWISEGWVYIEAKESKQVVNYLPANRTMYYYAYAKDEKKFAGEHPLLVNFEEQFKIKNADMEKVKAENPKYMMINFRKTKLVPKNPDTRECSIIIE